MNNTNQKIILDTMIWYLLGRDQNVFEDVKKMNISPNYINILELCNTRNLINIEDSVRNAIRKLFRFQEYAIFEPPFLYVVNKHDDYVINNFMFKMLKFTEVIAEGDRIDETKHSEFYEHIRNYHDGSIKASQFFNEKVKDVRAQIKDKKDKDKYRRINSIPRTKEFISSFIKNSTNNKYSIDNVDLNQIELLIKTIDKFFQKMVLDKNMKMEAIDWCDLSILAYVGPGDKFWTKEGRLAQMIKEAGCERYLYEFN
jgi:hypothetical protein